MKEESVKQFRLKGHRWLFHAFMISGALNVGLLLTFIISVLDKSEGDLLVYEKRMGKKAPLLSLTNQQILRNYSACSFEVLVKELVNTTLAEEGYRFCDLALSCLVYVHHFDIERALSGTLFEKRRYPVSSVGDQEALFLFPDLTHTHYQAIFYFLDKEKWPFTPKGLFFLLKQQGKEADPSLAQAFFLTSPFYLIEQAFRFYPNAPTRETLLSLLLDGQWKEIESLYQTIRKDPERKIPSVGKFLSSYLFYHSAIAAKLLLLIDVEFAKKALSNEEMALLLSLSHESTPERISFLEEIEKGPRPQKIREEAGRILSSKEVEPVLLPLQAKKERFHRVEQGDTLWKISRKYRVEIAQLKKINKLQNDTLSPGIVLNIPEPLRSRATVGDPFLPDARGGILLAA